MSERILVPGWSHGFARKNRKGQTIFYIRKTINGVTHEVSTGKTSIVAAVKELERFELNDAYRPRRPGENRILPSLQMSPELRTGYLAQSKKKNGSGWLYRKELYLARWEERLGKADLQKLKLSDLAKHSPTNQEIAAIKSFFTWLISTGQIEPSQNPTIGLKKDAYRPAQNNHTKVIPAEDWEKVHAWLMSNPSRQRSRVATALGMEVLLGTGWHVSALIRFAAAGTIRIEDGETIITTPKEKHGRAQSNRVSARVAKAAVELRALGANAWVTDRNRSRSIETVSEGRIHNDIKAAREATGVAFFGMGHHRHTVSTEAFNVLGDHGKVAAAIGNSAEMQRSTYSSLGTAPKLFTRI